MICGFSLRSSHILILISFILIGIIVFGNSAEQKKERKYVHSKQDLETTKLDPIIDANPCPSTHPVAIFIHVAAQVTGRFYDRRKAVRNTWLNDTKAHNISAYFVLALNKSQTVNDLIREESNRFNDIIQMNFIDDYFNLTLKMISSFVGFKESVKNLN